MLMQFAEEVFGFWDQENDGYIVGAKIAERIIELGLAPNKEFVFRMLSGVIKLDFKVLHKYKVTFEQFKKLTLSSRMVSRLVKLLNQATLIMLKDKKLID